MDVSFLPTQGYWGPNAFIAAQTPLPDTVADFWTMIVQNGSSAVVMLSDEVLEKINIFFFFFSKMCWYNLPYALIQCFSTTVP